MSTELFTSSILATSPVIFHLNIETIFHITGGNPRTVLPPPDNSWLTGDKMLESGELHFHQDGLQGPQVTYLARFHHVPSSTLLGMTAVCLIVWV